MLPMSVTELVSQVLMSRLKLFMRGAQPVRPGQGSICPLSWNKLAMLVIPVVHDVESAALLALAKLCSMGRATLVNVTPLMSNVSPTLTPGHTTVTPFGKT